MSIECIRCKTANSDGAKYCVECGNSLAPQIGPLNELLDSTLRSRVQEIFSQHYKDQKVVEIETTQAIASRFLDWSKLFAYFIGIPIALLLFFFGLLGFKTYSDLSGKIEEAKTKVETAQKAAAQLKAEGDSLASEYQKLRTQFSDTAALGEQVKSLSAKVDVIGEKLGFTPTSKISPEAKSQIEATFSKFQNYIKGLGHQGTGEPISIDVRDKMDQGMISYYIPEKRMMVIDSKYVSEAAVVYREYMHLVLYPDGIPREDPLHYAIESGLAWYFPCSFIGDPKPAGTATSWDLTRKRRFADMRPEFDSALIDGTEIWGSAFWELRQILGQSAADKLLFDAWFELSADEVRNDGGASFVRKLFSLDKSHEAQIRAVFVQRGLSL